MKDPDMSREFRRNISKKLEQFWKMEYSCDER